MKKKIVNVLLSAAVITTMMFSVTACGSKADDAQNTAADVPVETQAADANETQAADAEEQKDDTADAAMSLEEWAESDVCTQFIEMMNQGMADQGVSIFFEVEGDVIALVYQYDEQIDVADDAEESMSKLFDENASTFGMLRDEIIDKTDNENVVLRIEYRNADDSVIFSQDFGDTDTDTDDQKDEAADGVMSLDEWTKTDLWAELMDEMNEGMEEDGMAISYEVDGDVLTLVCQFDEQFEALEDLDDDNKEMFEEIMSSIFDGFVDVFETLRDGIIDETGNDNVVLRVEYRNVDGSVLYSQEF